MSGVDVFYNLSDINLIDVKVKCKNILINNKKG